jgi:hypothetical protein
LEAADETFRTEEETCGDEGEGASSRFVVYEGGPQKEAISNCCHFSEDSSQCRRASERPTRKEKEDIVSIGITASTKKKGGAEAADD